MSDVEISTPEQIETFPGDSRSSADIQVLIEKATAKRADLSEEISNIDKQITEFYAGEDTKGIDRLRTRRQGLAEEDDYISDHLLPNLRERFDEARHNEKLCEFESIIVQLVEENAQLAAISRELEEIEKQRQAKARERAACLSRVESLASAETNWRYNLLPQLGISQDRIEAVRASARGQKP